MRVEITTEPTDGYKSRDLQLVDYLRKNCKQLVGGKVEICQMGRIIFACEFNQYHGSFVRGFMKKVIYDSNAPWHDSSIDPDYGYDWISKKLNQQKKRKMLLEANPDAPDTNNALLTRYHVANYLLNRDKHPKYQKLKGNFAPVIEHVTIKQEERRRKNNEML